MVLELHYNHSITAESVEQRLIGNLHNISELSFNFSWRIPELKVSPKYSNVEYFDMVDKPELVLLDEMVILFTILRLYPRCSKMDVYIFGKFFQLRPLDIMIIDNFCTQLLDSRQRPTRRLRCLLFQMNLVLYLVDLRPNRFASNLPPRDRCLYIATLIILNIIISLI